MPTVLEVEDQTFDLIRPMPGRECKDGRTWSSSNLCSKKINGLVSPNMHRVQRLVFRNYKTYEGSRDTFSISPVMRAPCARWFLRRTRCSLFIRLIPLYVSRILREVSSELPEDTKMIPYCVHTTTIVPRLF
jgi:hypothetical protein